MTVATGIVVFASLVTSYFDLGLRKTYYQAFKGNVEVPVAPSVWKLVNKVIRDLEISDEEAANMEVIMASVDEPQSWGCLSWGFKPLLGFPFSFLWEKAEDVDLDKLVFGTDGKISDATAKDGFIESCVLSEEAKLFVVAREMAKMKDDDLRELGRFVAYIAATFSGLLARHYSILLAKLNRAPRIVKILINSSVLVFVGTVYLSVMDRVGVRFEDYIDHEVSYLGDEYLRGGVEYYDKLLVKRKALREMVPNDMAKKYYNLKGNLVPGLFTTKGLPTTYRKHFFEEKLRERENLNIVD